MSEFQKNCVDVFRKVSLVPSLVELTVTKTDDGNVFWDALWSQRDLKRNSKIKYRSSGMVTQCGSNLTTIKTPYSTETNGEKLFRPSPCNNYVAVIREVDVENKKNLFLEIWNGSFKSNSINLTDEDKHGTVHSTPSFCCIEWSPDSKKLLYVAEKKLQPTTSFFKTSQKTSDATKGDEHVYRQEWGEQLVGCCEPTIVIYDVASNDVTVMDDCVPEGMCVIEAIWKNSTTLIIVAVPTEPWKLGLVYCNNRPTTLFEFEIENHQRIPLTSGKTCALSPRLAPDKHTLTYLEAAPFGPHRQCAKLMALDLANKCAGSKAIIDVVRNCDKNGFRGLYLSDLPRQPWLGNSNKMVVSSEHQFSMGLFLIDVNNAEVQPLATSEEWSIQSVCDHLLFVSHSNPSLPPQLKVGQYREDGIEWIVLDRPCMWELDIGWEVFVHRPLAINKEYTDLSYESMLLKPKSGLVRGLIVNPHGGPHSSNTTSFGIMTSAFCSVGYAVLLINYRGSLGYGQDSIYSLPGNIGVQDVSDVQQAVKQAAKLLALPKSKVYIHGGSHGGFLTLHLIGQNPDYYAAAGVRNPVTCIASMVSTTDIPDWCFCETSQNFSYKYDPRMLNYTQMVSVSPIALVDRVKTPLLMMVGSVDLRVPPTQSYEYYRLLKAHDRTVKILKYDKNDHPLAEVLVEADCFMNMCLWFDQHGEQP